MEDIPSGRVRVTLLPKADPVPQALPLHRPQNRTQSKRCQPSLCGSRRAQREAMAADAS